MPHYMPPRYRVLAKSKEGELYAREKPTLESAVREARSLLSGGWRDIAIQDRRAGVLWTLSRWEEPRL